MVVFKYPAEVGGRGKAAQIRNFVQGQAGVNQVLFHHVQTYARQEGIERVARFFFYDFTNILLAEMNVFR